MRHQWCEKQRAHRCLTSLVLHQPPHFLWRNGKSGTFVQLKKRVSPVCKSLQLQNHEPETMSNLSMCDLVASSGVIVYCNKLDTVCLTNMVPKRTKHQWKKEPRVCQCLVCLFRSETWQSAARYAWDRPHDTQSHDFNEVYFMLNLTGTTKKLDRFNKR